MNGSREQIGAGGEGGGDKAPPTTGLGWLCLLLLLVITSKTQSQSVLLCSLLLILIIVSCPCVTASPFTITHYTNQAITDHPTQESM